MKKKEKTFRETDLAGPIGEYLKARGYTVRSEVEGCDIAASKGDDLIVVELKRSFGTELLIQATDRQRVTDSVYVAIPALPDMGPGKRWRGVRRLCRQLEIGLIVVFLGGVKPRVEVIFHPVPYKRRKRPAHRSAIIEEMDGRSADYNEGGSTRRKLVTAYRENAIQIACFLDYFGALTPRQLREMGTGKKTLSILYGNVYEWFDRVEKGVYRINRRAKKELEAYPELAMQYRTLAQVQFRPED